MTNLELSLIAAAAFASMVSMIVQLRTPMQAVMSRKHASVVIDTSGFMDGRISGIASSGFLPNRIIISLLVVKELQSLADQADPSRRGRARGGLDILSDFKRNNAFHIEFVDSPPAVPVDDELVSIAKRHGAALYTTDFNLNKVAALAGVKVLNPNELAKQLRAPLLPGELVTIKLVQRGQGEGQALGYLADGTLVIVEQAKRLVGHEVTVVCTRVLQTDAGKMLFAKISKDVL